MKKIKFDKDKALEYLNAGHTAEQTAKYLGMSYTTFWKNCKKEGINFLNDSKINKETFLELYNKGMSDPQIAKEMNYGKSAIQAYRSKMSLKPNTVMEVNLTPEQYQIIIGGLLGDSYMNIPKGGANAYFTFRHSLKQKNYCLWKHNQLKEYCFNPYEIGEYDPRTDKTYYGITIISRRHKIFTDIMHSFYKVENGKKIKYINEDVINSLTPLGIAIWFMDDGFKINSGGLCLSTDCFSDDDLKIIQNFFLFKYNITTTVHAGNRIYFPIKEAKKLVKLIYPYIHPDCYYKIETVVTKLRESGELLNEDNPNPSTPEME